MLKEIYQRLYKITAKSSIGSLYFLGKWQELIRRQTLKLCNNITGRVLEIGCGEGLFLERLAKINPTLEIWGIDNNPLCIREAEIRMGRANLKNVNLRLEDAFNLSFPDNYFDLVVCINFILILSSSDLVKNVLGEINRVLKRKGKIIFDFRNRLNPLLLIKYRLAKYYDGTVKDLPLRSYYFEEIEDLLKKLNFQILQKKHLGFSLRIKKFSPIVIIEAEKI
ncbi:MAG: class I SAM-dependent methyltransferase [Candidatus Omnitrophica bacterium]|nr:class I SAM-dependent methyltransferase [Candidatus Omnitrophota bacterium]